jgi:cytochrome c556
MKTWLLGAAAVAVALGGLGAARLAADDKAPTVEEIMKKVNAGKGAIHRTLKTDLDTANPNWAEIQKKTKEYSALADFLGKNDPPKGDKADWEKQTKAYAASAKALYEAAQKKDKATAMAVHGKISKSCMGCHRQHKPD